ncbi:MAG: TonB C-terminal domain-containing protein [Gammaproteobacteria bacterium]|nr:TonB C-terminal domain-containing protein [Gammaproteobacteria bacterium]
MKSAFRFTIAFSILLHLLVFTPWLLSPSTPKPIVEKPRTITFDLQPNYQQPLDMPPPPEHMEDDITKANTSDGETLSKQTSQNPSQQKKQVAQKPITETENKPQPEVITTQSQGLMLSDFLKAQETAKETLAKKGLNMSELDEEEKARWFNEVLKRITEQVNYVWVKPEGLSSNTWGVIRLDIDRHGYLLDAWVHLPSGNAQLDRSAMRAVKQVFRYDIPHSEKLARYYQHLEFRYRGDEQEG